MEEKQKIIELLEKYKEGEVKKGKAPDFQGYAEWDDLKHKFKISLWKND
tara:strand:- start:290 stop:436 length:147 start_codon:yes stop_codon:yes gene_type:complete